MLAENSLFRYSPSLSWLSDQNPDWHFLTVGWFVYDLNHSIKACDDSDMANSFNDALLGSSYTLGYLISKAQDRLSIGIDHG